LGIADGSSGRWVWFVGGEVLRETDGPFLNLLFIRLGGRDLDWHAETVRA